MFPATIGRRTFLKTALAGAFCLCSARAVSGAFPSPRVPGGRLALYNIHTSERLQAEFRDREGRYDPDALAAIDRILRCHYTDEVARIDIDVIDYLDAVDKSLGGRNDIHVISGFRSRAYNDKLVREGRGVVPGSLHLSGRAIDFRIPGIGLKAVRQAALSLAAGGVGYYPASGFVHIDSGRARSW